MRGSSHNKTVRKLRKICRLTQAQLAGKVGCARLTIQALETGRLKLTDRMAEKISLHTGVSQSWLLADDPLRVAVCQKDPSRPFTVEVYGWTRAEIEAPRTDFLDVVQIGSFLGHAYWELTQAARVAYERDEVIYFNYTLREFLTKLREQWPFSSMAPSCDARELQVASNRQLEVVRQRKLAKTKRNQQQEAKRR